MTKEVIWCNKATQGNIKRGFIPIYFSCHDMHINAPSLFFNQKWLTPARTTTSHCSPGGVLREFLVGVSRWQNDKPTLVYGKWTENHTLTYGIPCEIRPMSIQNMQTKMLFGGTIYKILRVWEWQVISSLLHSSIKNITLVTDYLRKRCPSLRIQGSNKYPSQRLNPNNPHIVSTPPGSASVLMT